jgi:hypothetical protein
MRAPDSILRADVQFGRFRCGNQLVEFKSNQNLLITMYEEARQAARRLAMQRLYQHIMLFVSVLLTACTSILQASKPLQPYHTSILSGEGWAMELLNGHPNHIRCELGVSHDIFTQLVYELRGLGYGNSKYFA